MGGQQNGHAGAIQLPHIVPKALAQLDIDAGGGLVQDQHRRRMDQGLADQQAPPHAAGQGAGIGAGLIGQVDQIQNFGGATFRWRHTEQAGLQLQGFARGEEGIDVQFLRHHPDGGARLTWRGVDVDAPN